MAKKKTKEVQDFQNDLDDFLKSSMGLEVQTLNEHEQVPYWINSGSYALNWVIGDDMFKGFPGTKVIMVSGEEARGKSLVTDVWLGENIRFGGMSIKIDVEDSIGKEFTVKVIGDEAIANQIRIISPSTEKAVKKAEGDIKKLKSTDLVITIEKMTSILNKLVDWQLSKGKDKLKSIVVVIDSVSVLTSIKEVEDIADEKEKKDMTPQQKMRAFFRATNQKFKEANITVVGVAHLTANIGVQFGPKKTVSAKGSGFKYANSLTVNCVSSKEIIDPKTDTPIGIRMKMQTTKNRVAYKGRITFLYMYFNYGIDPYGGLGELLTQFNLATASSKAKLDGSYSESTTFTYKDLKWKSHELWDIMNGMQEEIREDWLNDMNNELAKAYDSALSIRGVTEEEFIETDDPLEDEA